MPALETDSIYKDAKKMNKFSGIGSRIEGGKDLKILEYDISDGVSSLIFWPQLHPFP